MPADPLKLAALTHAAIRSIAADPGSPGWMAAMERAIAQGHTAGFLVGTAERLQVAPDSPLLSRQRLSRAERKDITDRVAAQRPYLQQFAADIRDGGLSEAQIAARAQLYAGATRATYSAARWRGAGLPAQPTEGCECMTNCRCQWVERDGAMYWERAAGDSCPTCRSREAQWAPWRG